MISEVQPSGSVLSRIDRCAFLREYECDGVITIHHCNTVHHSAPNTTEHSQLGLLFVFRGNHVQTDPVMKATYSVAATATPPA